MILFYHKTNPFLINIYMDSMAAKMFSLASCGKFLLHSGPRVRWLSVGYPNSHAVLRHDYHIRRRGRENLETAVYRRDVTLVHGKLTTCRQNTCMVSWLNFFLLQNRYISPLGYIVIIVCTLERDIQAGYAANIFTNEAFHDPWPKSVCQRYVQYPEILKIFTSTAIGGTLLPLPTAFEPVSRLTLHPSSVVFILRLYSIYSRNRVILVAFSIFLLFELSVKIVSSFHATSLVWILRPSCRLVGVHRWHNVTTTTPYVFFSCSALCLFGSGRVQSCWPDDKIRESTELIGCILTGRSDR